MHDKIGNGIGNGAGNGVTIDHSLELYICKDDEETLKLFEGFNVTVKDAPLDYEAAYGLPVLFSRYGISCGVKAIKRLLRNIS